jgi:exonuclease SbcD
VVTVDAKVARWCELASVDPDPLLERLQLLETGDAEAIASSVLDRIAQVGDSTEVPEIPGGTTNIVPLAAASIEATPEPESKPSLSWLNDDLFAA